MKQKAKQLFASLDADPRVTRLIPETVEGRKSNPIIATFLLKAKANPSLSWGSFIQRHKHMEDYLLQKLIVVEREGYDSVRDEEHYPKVWQTMRGIRFEQYPNAIVDHDSDNFVLIHLLRHTHEADPMGHIV